MWNVCKILCQFRPANRWNTRIPEAWLTVALLFVSGHSTFAADADPAAPSSAVSKSLPVRSLPRENQLLFHDTQGAIQPVKSVEDWQLRRQETLHAIQAILGTLPGEEKRCPLELKVEEETDGGTFFCRRITYQSEPGCRVPAYLLIPKIALQKKDQKAPAVLCLHQTTPLGPEEIVGLGGDRELWYAKELADRGYVVLAPNYPLLAKYHPDLKTLGWESGLLKAVWDNIRGLDLLDELPFVKTGRYAAIGHSLGGHNSVFTALFDDRLQGVVSSCGLDALIDYYNGNPEVWLPERGWTQSRYVPRLAAYRGRLQEIPFDYHEIIASLAPRSVFISAPLNDTNFRSDSVDRIALAARPIFELYKVPDHLQVEHPKAGHAFPREMREKAYVLIDLLLKSSLQEELPRLPFVEADKALETFQLEHGFTLEQVAAEPLVGDPVDACFDEFGRMFVAEFHAYPYALEKDQIIPAGKGRTETGIIRMLEDLNGDGVMDRSTVYADKFDWPVSVVPYNGGVFVIDPPDVYYIKDTDGDGKADIRELVFSHLGRNNVQGIANNMKWGLDNQIYVASGSNGGEVNRRGETLLKLGRSDWKFDPKTEQVEKTSGGIQFGHSMDDWGNRFLCSNSVQIMAVVFEDRYLSRNPYCAVRSPVRAIAREGGAAPVFRRSPIEPWRIVRTRRRVSDPKYQHLPETERHAGGFFTSAAGVTIYRGTAYPPEFRGNAFVGDVGSNLVHRMTVTPSGATFEATRADPGTEIVTSTDTWFRPVNYVNAPDGTLYILDMYRETIEHPISIPEDIKALLDLESGNDRGRIYRLVSPGMKRINPPSLGDASLPELVNNLAAANSWNRETAQRLIWERQDPATVPLIIELFEKTDSPLGRLHSLYSLQGLNALTPELLLKGMQDPHPGVRQHAVQLSEPFLAAHPQLAEKVLKFVDDPEFRPRFQAVLALGFMPEAAAVKGLKQFAPTLGKDADMQSAFLLSVGAWGDPLVKELLLDQKFLQQSDAEELLVRVTEMIGARPEQEAATSLLLTLGGDNVSSKQQSRLIRALAEGLSRRGTSLSKLIASLPAESAVRTQITQLFATTAQIAMDENADPATRQNAVLLLAYGPWDVASGTFESLLAPQIPQQIQTTAITALNSVSSPEVATLLLNSWRGLTLAARDKALDVLLGRADRTDALLDAVEKGIVKRNEIDRAKYPLLLKHPQEKIRKRATAILASDQSDRKQVVEEYQKSLELVGNAESGRQLFSQKCALCHRVGDIGHQVGPDPTSFQNKTPADLLVAILDPSREAQLNFTTYTVSTMDGRIYSGIISAESAGSLTLKRAEAKEDVILRSQIDELTSSGMSLMPEGLEKEINPQQLADLIVFIKSLKAPAAVLK